MSKRDKEAMSMKDAMDRYLKAMGLDEKVKETAALAKWPEVVGEPVAARTIDLYMREQILYVKMNSSVMRDEMLQKKSIIIQRMNDAAGYELIKDIFFK